jgi:SAM-dependent methyltransferase
MFAKVYDLLMSDVDYEQIYDFLKPYLKPYDFICDAGCGSGYLLLELIQRKHHAIGIDLSSEMLAIASEKLKAHGVSAMLYEHDLRKPMAAEFDCILAMFDVINYFKGAKQVLKNLYHALDDQGILIFDLYKRDEILAYHQYQEKEIDPIAYSWTIDVNLPLVKHQVEVDHHIDIIKQYVYPLEYYLEILNDLGFKTKVLNGPDIRKHYIVAQK